MPGSKCAVSILQRETFIFRKLSLYVNRIGTIAPHLVDLFQEGA